MKRVWVSVAIVLFFSTACGGGEESEALPEVDCMTMPVPTFAQVTAFQKCTVCHSSALEGAARQSAPPAYNFDTHAGAALDPEEVAHEVYEGAMPPATSGQVLTEEEKQVLYRWALCGAPM